MDGPGKPNPRCTPSSAPAHVNKGKTTTVIDRDATYSATCNNFMAEGGDGFTTFVSGSNQVGGPIDLDALIDYVEADSPFAAGPLDRITRL
jgi:2',3'-cyclic-nucleotide 2'-phosphodiesterase (5'-nucleotidase family)